MVGLDQFITKNATLTNEKAEDAHPIKAMKFSVSPVVKFLLLFALQTCPMVCERSASSSSSGASYRQRCHDEESGLEYFDYLFCRCYCGAPLLLPAACPLSSCLPSGEVGQLQESCTKR